ncbi:uncharacterized protein KD926_004560 [Aspergillus affinis]|uniref:uncharacterized protein n=1 Tax=Aspergillus affinis TaxID=1070780 RepID=UPI0022FDD398|nr:uncharacterized protein KD926_004560 [Aspergillus affinis]KAI9043057.1 hypothetical protein KD926_004560 [Aspergillus affinis]
MRPDSDSEESCPDIIDAWVWIHIPKIKDLEERYWAASQQLENGNYTVYYMDPKTLDNKKRELVMKLKIQYHVDLENRSDEIEHQLGDDIEGILEILEARRGAQGADPSSDDDDGESEDEENEDEPQPQPEPQPQVDNQDYDSEASTMILIDGPIYHGPNSDADDDSDLESETNLILKGETRYVAQSGPVGPESDVDTDDIVGGL